MKYDEYLNMTCERFPNMHFDKIPQFGKIDCVKKVAECLFMESDNEGCLVEETRHQLIHLMENGMHDFK